MLRFDYTDLVAPNGAIPEADWESSSSRATAAVERFRAFASEPTVRFTHLPGLSTADIDREAARLRARFSDLVVVGIGGSSLGGRALHAALTSTRHKTPPAPGCRLWFLENVDADDISDLLAGLPLETTAVNVVTKSGGTIETMSAFFVLRERLLQAFGEEGYRERVVATTDPASGDLRRLVTDERLRSLPVPPGVGGRFSVLSAVGLLPLAAAGIDTGRILAGARAAREASLRDLDANPAAQFARAHTLLIERGVPDLVFMPYASGLFETALWFIQLWAESLGKVRPDGTRVGPTPIAAVGAVDQHSQLQLFMEGPPNKSVVFVDPGPSRTALTVPDMATAFAPLGHLSGRAFDELRDAELRGVRAGLIEAGRSVATLSMQGVTPETMGALIFTLEAATAMAGWMLGVEPFDQPGVEAGKLFAHGLLGKPSAESWAARAHRLEGGARRSVSV